MNIIALTDENFVRLGQVKHSCRIPFKKIKCDKIRPAEIRKNDT